MHVLCRLAMNCLFGEDLIELHLFWLENFNFRISSHRAIPFHDYDPGDKCHHREIGENERMVQIDLIHDHCQMYPLPIPHPDLRDLMDALGSFILWPVELIAPDSDEVSIFKRCFNFF